MGKARIDDAELLLRLYELRRDPEMRRARAFMLSEFKAQSWDELRPHYLTGDELDRHFRMTTSYWEMVAAFVNRGLIDEELFFDTHGEDIVIWSRIAPVVAGARAQIRPTWVWNLERLAKRHQAWREASYRTATRVIEKGSSLGKAATRAGGSVRGKERKRAR
jgi:hypothetical protein